MLYFSNMSQLMLLSETLNTPIEPCLALVSCLLAHVFRPYMVMYKTMQHGSTFLKKFAKEFNNVLLIKGLFIFLQ